MSHHSNAARVLHSPVRRATRYAIAAPLSFRTNGAWHEGTTVDIAACGLLFLTSGTAPAIWKPVDLRVVLCGDSSETCSLLTCRGRVVRVEAPPGSDQVAIAVAFDDYEMRPTPRPQASSSAAAL